MLSGFHGCQMPKLSSVTIQVALGRFASLALWMVDRLRPQ